MHKLDDDTLISPTLLRQFIAFAIEDNPDDQHFAVMQRSDGNWLVHNPGSPQLDPVQFAWSQRVLNKLNRELHHDGAWVVCWSGPGLRQQFIHSPDAYSLVDVIWLDKDGDAKFRWNWEAGQNEHWTHIVELFMAGELPVCEQCETAWQTTNELLKATLDTELNKTSDVSHKRALGERAPSALH